jgi:hypothetical protein
MYAEISSLYVTYIKFLYNYKIKSNLLSIRISDVSQKVKSLSVQDILFSYESFDALVTQTFSIFEH